MKVRTIRRHENAFGDSYVKHPGKVYDLGPRDAARLTDQGWWRPMTIRVKIEGLKDLDRALTELPKATARNTLKRVLKKAAEPVEAAMEAKAPRLTGYTARSIGTSFTLNPRQRREAKKEGKAFAEIHIGSLRGSAAILQEFGTADQPAQPYMRPAWEQTQDGALETISAELGGEISKSADRLAAKAARLAAKG